MMKPERIAIIGGGIAGLAAAHRIVELDPTLDVHLFEATDRLGGSLETVHRNGFLIERGADSFITSPPWAVELCRRVGLEDELLETNTEFRRALVVHRGKLHPMPDGFMLMAPMRLWPLATTPLLSLRGKLRVLSEWLIPQRSMGDESLAEFATRRLGREAFERLVQPLVGGIYTADPAKLSVAATMPRFLEMERTYGSLTRAALASRRRANAEGSGARYSMFATLKGGLSTLVERLSERLPAEGLHLGTPVESLEQKADSRWNVRFVAASGPSQMEFDRIIIATSAPAAARLLDSVDATVAADLYAIAYAGTAVVTAGYRRDQVGNKLEAFGLVVPAVERRRILAVSFSSSKFPGRAPDDNVLLRTFVGGACQAQLAQLPRGELWQLVADELSTLLEVRGEPQVVDIARWTAAMPQYHVGHCEHVGRIERGAASLKGLHLAGNAYHGVGIPSCIQSGESAAEKALGVESDERPGGSI